jgi:CMP-N-acetylneuraminic acid synthetase
MNASIYVFKPDFLKKVNKKLFEGNMMMYLMRDIAVLDIDDWQDHELMEVIGKYWWMNNSGNL